MRNTFKVYERLKKEQHIDTLFRTGKAFSVFPIRLIWQLVPRQDTELSPVLAGFSVPKRKFSRSVDRHYIRRLLVEAWRMNKHIIYSTIPPGNQLHLFFIYTDAITPNYETLEPIVKKSIEKLIGNINPGS